MTNKDYKATSIQVLKGLESVRENYDLNELASNINVKGDLDKVSKSLNIDYSSLKRAIEEVKILSVFPELSKSKTVPLSRLKTKKELILFSNENDIYKLEVRRLYSLVKQFRIELEKNPKILLSDLQHDLIIGSLMGDANVRQRDKNCSFRVCHSIKQKRYLDWKYNILKDFIPSEAKLNQKILNGRLLNTFEISTFTHTVFNFYRKLFYKNNVKQITREILHLLNPRSLAIWICDDGSYSRKQGYITLCTNSYTLEEHKFMKEYFENIWQLSPTIGFRDKKYYYLRFKKKDTKKLISIIKDNIPSGMEYKIGEK